MREEATPMTDLTGFQRDTLAVIAKLDGEYGLAIKRELEALMDEDVNHGRLYPNLDELKQRGLIEKSERDKRTNEYNITADGRRALSNHIEWYISADE